MSETLFTNLHAVLLLQVLSHGFRHGFKEEPRVLQKRAKGYPLCNLPRNIIEVHYKQSESGETGTEIKET